MNRILTSLFALASLLALAPAALGQARPYVGFVYPAGGQQGTTFQVKLGGQSLDGLNEVLVTGTGVSAKIIEHYKPLGPQEMRILGEQLRELKPARGKPRPDEATQTMISRVEKRMREYCNRPQSRALAHLAFIEVTIAHDAPPGERELRLETLRGVSNPMVFHVGQLPEVSRKPMLTSNYQLLGKEELALRKRPAEEIEERITVPSVVNGQVASGEVNRYRFNAQKGQRLVIKTQARQLIPYLADAVPGWFQPVLALHDATGKEVAYDDDYRFKPDPLIIYEVPKDGEYVFSIYDSIYRGREDFVYRISIGELPVLTSIFPLGGRVGEPVKIQMQGWNLKGATIAPPAKDAGPGIHSVAAGKAGFVSNRLPFALDTLPEAFDQEPNSTQSAAQKVTLPIIINGRIDQPDDWDVFEFAGKAGQAVVAEVHARRLDSPLDSVIKLTDASGKLLAFSDDVEDLGAGVNTHHADSYFLAKLPADGTYYVHIGDTARKGGTEYGYRLRLSAPRPDFALRVVPSSVAMRSKGTANLSVYAIRKDGFTGPIKVELKGPKGFSATTVTLSGTTPVARLTVKTDEVATKEVVNLSIVGTTKVQEQEIVNPAVPAEDRMQAFLWRHLVPATELKALVYNPSYQPPPVRIPRERKPVEAAAKTASATAKKPMFTKQQVAGRLRQLKQLFEEFLLTDDFYDAKVAECDTVL